MSITDTATTKKGLANTTSSPKKQRGHVSPRRPILDLNCEGRLRTGEVMALSGKSHSGLYSHMKDGRFPKPDGNDGRNFWNTSTMRTHLKGGA